MKGATKGRERLAEPAQWRPPPAKRPNILMTLPPELRNIIYEAVLVVKDDYVRICCHDDPPWQEPPLLCVSKTIRAEASSIYYKGNDFIIFIWLSRMRALYTNLQCLIERGGLRPVKSLHVIIHKPYWSHMHCARDLAMIYYRYRGIQLCPIRRPYDDLFVGKPPTNYGMCYEALSMAAELGKRGADGGWSVERMKARLNQWLALCLSNKGGGKNSKGWKLAMEI
ncbi:hypothetical protein LTR91_019827 [Friedmanniomyces endolithicus]|uniref:Uncharacterized protein n=2 Tax=Dothideomycetidae TaxID=451867 RepID=A0AAN6H9Z0_9PEZI|nr:hypothetical protein LTR94_010515 [Friedmanniomyces endolithicus]KAK5140530.1 hypothetical protein LTR32_006693 [Rachicladosporium monterosium]KAK0793623.1 hypothetical protein LTR38_009497 [Friedmanniomyces endolithicus]KAK0796860.1 hypothetical protein LTR59_007001 [Friedmanniomyces endolithicus]KAK0807819.1 hypothetical protein LTR75_006454 [Friedmanniomyces endolithicus]